MKCALETCHPPCSERLSMPCCSGDKSVESGILAVWPRRQSIAPRGSLLVGNPQKHHLRSNGMQNQPFNGGEARSSEGCEQPGSIGHRPEMRVASNPPVAFRETSTDE